MALGLMGLVSYVVCVYIDFMNNLFVLLLQVFQDTYPTEKEEVGRDEEAIIKKSHMSDGNYFPVSLFLRCCVCKTQRSPLVFCTFPLKWLSPFSDRFAISLPALSAQWLLIVEVP